MPSHYRRPYVATVLPMEIKPFTPRPVVAPKVFCGVRPGHVPRVYTTWKAAQQH